MRQGKIIFAEHFLEYFFNSLGLLMLSVLTVGIRLPD